MCPGRFTVCDTADALRILREIINKGAPLEDPAEADSKKGVVSRGLHVRHSDISTVRCRPQHSFLRSAPVRHGYPLIAISVAHSVWEQQQVKEDAYLRLISSLKVSHTRLLTVSDRSRPLAVVLPRPQHYPDFLLQTQLLSVTRILACGSA